MSNDTVIVYEEGPVSVIVVENPSVITEILTGEVTPSVIEIITQGPQGIPGIGIGIKGDKGDKGEDGLGFSWIGAWAT